MDPDQNPLNPPAILKKAERPTSLLHYLQLSSSLFSKAQRWKEPDDPFHHVAGRQSQISGSKSDGVIDFQPRPP